MRCRLIWKNNRILTHWWRKRRREVVEEVSGRQRFSVVFLFCITTTPKKKSPTNPLTVTAAALGRSSSSPLFLAGRVNSELSVTVRKIFGLNNRQSAARKQSCSSAPCVPAAARRFLREVTVRASITGGCFTVRSQEDE